MTQNLSPATQALAYRIWAHCQPIGWNCTIMEIADALGVDWHRVNWVLGRKGWSGRVRVAVALRGSRFSHSTAKLDGADILLGKSEFDTAQFMEAEE
jgi:hypothetical protein